MRIGIDARMYGASNAGLGRYVQKLIKQLEKINSDNEYVIFLLEENFDKYQPQSPNFKKVKIKSCWYTLSEHFEIPRVVKKHKIDLMHFPHFNVPWFLKTRYVVTVHDLIMTHYPDSRATTKMKFIYWLKIRAYRLIISRAVRRAERVITVSEASKKDIVKNLKVSAEKILVTYEGFDLKAYDDGNSFDLEKFELTGPYLLYVGNAYPHKNLETLILAFEKLAKKRKGSLQLVLVGKRDFFSKRLEQKVKQLGLEERIIFTGYVKDEDLVGLYENAEMFVFPSLLEGFGLPPLEAMDRGVAVASSQSSCMPEILGDAALYFDPEKTDEMIDSIEKILNNPELKKNMIEKGKIRTEKYSWHSCAQKTLNIYSEIK